MSSSTIPFLNLRAQHAMLGPDLRAAMARVMDRGWFILGPEVEAFELEFASLIGARHAVGVGSGTDALSLALQALGVGPGTEVITSPLTSVFTAIAISRLGAKPVFADVNSVTLNISPESAEEKVNPRTRAIIPVHLYGNSCELSDLKILAKEKRLVMVEDACQAHGGRYHQRALGTWGDAGCFSFSPTANLGALGDGGMVVTENEDLASRLRRLRNGGKVNRYMAQEIGPNSHLDELQAALLRAKLPHLAGWNDRRRRLSALYRARLDGTPVVPVETISGAVPSSHRFVVKVPERTKLRLALSGAGVETFIHYPVPIHLQPAFRVLNQGEGSCPQAELAADQVVSLPLFPEMSEAQVEQVAGVIKQFYTSVP